MIIFDLIAHFVAPLLAILLPLVPVLDAVRATVGHRTVSQSRSIGNAWPLTSTGTGAGSRPLADAGTLRDSRTRPLASRQGPRTRSATLQKLGRCATCHTARNAGGDGPSRSAWASAWARASTRANVQEVLQLAR
jgi:hypothetical protein